MITANIYLYILLGYIQYKDTQHTHTYHYLLIFQGKKLNPREVVIRLNQVFCCQRETKIRALTSVLEMTQETFFSEIPLNIEGSVNWH